MHRHPYIFLIYKHCKRLFTPAEYPCMLPLLIHLAVDYNIVATNKNTNSGRDYAHAQAPVPAQLRRSA